MSGKIIYEMESPKTQSLDAVRSLLMWRKMPVDPMPDYVELPGGVFLVRNNKKDAYYVTTEKACSCPSYVYRGVPCKHMAKHFPQEPKRAEGDLLSQVNSRASREQFYDGMAKAGVV